MIHPGVPEDVIMTRRAERAGFFSEKRKLSKYETTIESAFKQKRVYTATTGATTLTYVPDTIVLEDGANTASAVTLPGTFFDEDKEVTVINKDTGETIAVGTSGSPVTCAAAAKTVLYFNGTAWARLYEQTGVTTT